jgi:hypothetical protein
VINSLCKLRQNCFSPTTCLQRLRKWLTRFSSVRSSSLGSQPELAIARAVGRVAVPVDGVGSKANPAPQSPPPLLTAFFSASKATSRPVSVCGFQGGDLKKKERSKWVNWRLRGCFPLDSRPLCWAASRAIRDL